MLARAIAIVAVTLACGLSGAQEKALPRVGFLANTIPTRELFDGTSTHPAVRAMVDGLRALGWVDGKNMRLVWRSAENDLTRLPGLVDELLRERVDVIVGYGPGAYVAMERNETVPVVMGASTITGPLAVDGKVRIRSLANPGGNVTGLSLAIGEELNGKRLEILKQAAPRVKRVAFLTNAAPGTFGPHTRSAAERLGLTLQYFGYGRECRDSIPLSRRWSASAWTR